MRLRLLALALTFATTLAAAAQSPVNITVDLGHPIGVLKPITSWFGYDEANYSTAPHGRELLHELHDAYPVPVYIRAHHLLTTGDGVPALKWSSTNVYTLDAQGKPVYNFTILDQIFDAFKAAGVHPMVEFGFMPEALASGPAPYHLPYPKTVDGSVQSPPKDYAAWEELCRVFAAHMLERYGRAEVSQWYWEVWNEPNISYWHGSREDYFKLYDFAVAGVRAALPEARVGGPATTSPRSKQAADFLDAFLHHVANDKSFANQQPIPLDFISFHAKGSPSLIHAANGVPEHVRMSLAKELTDADKGFALIASYPQFRSLPIILSEADPEGCAACSARENPANAYRNGPLFPAYTAAVIKSFLDIDAHYNVNLLAMLTWSFEFEDKDYFQGFRTLATNGVDKPILNVFRMAGMMSGQRVATTSAGQIPWPSIIANGVESAPDIDALASTDSHSAAVLLWNYQDDDLPAPAASVIVKISGIPAGVPRVLLQHYRIDDTHSNAYSAWLAMGSPQQPTADQLAHLKQAGQLELLTSPIWVDVKDSTITLPVRLPRQATSLLRLSW
jgi:xylan 1,4-beta-xylosidase